MKLKIATDGTPQGTQITNTETGESLENKTTAVVIEIEPGKCSARVTLMCDDVHFESGGLVVFDTHLNQIMIDALGKIANGATGYSDNDVTLANIAQTALDLLK